MKKAACFLVFSVVLIAGCAIGFNGRGDLIVVPILPETIEIEVGQPYYQDGYYYSYRNDIWFYSGTQRGPWHRLPRNHYPRKVHYRNHN